MISTYFLLMYTWIIWLNTFIRTKQCWAGQMAMWAVPDAWASQMLVSGWLSLWLRGQLKRQTAKHHAKWASTSHQNASRGRSLDPVYHDDNNYCRYIHNSKQHCQIHVYWPKYNFLFMEFEFNFSQCWWQVWINLPSFLIKSVFNFCSSIASPKYKFWLKLVQLWVINDLLSYMYLWSTICSFFLKIKIIYEFNFKMIVMCIAFQMRIFNQTAEQDY